MFYKNEDCSRKHRSQKHQLNEAAMDYLYGNMEFHKRKIYGLRRKAINSYGTVQLNIIAFYNYILKGKEYVKDWHQWIWKNWASDISNKYN
jgi:hypothetical protein